jgi:hypothetical protein
MGETCSKHGGVKRGLCEVLLQQSKENSHFDDAKLYTITQYTL